MAVNNKKRANAASAFSSPPASKRRAGAQSPAVDKQPLAKRGTKPTGSSKSTPALPKKMAVPPAARSGRHSFRTAPLHCAKIPSTPRGKKVSVPVVPSSPTPKQTTQCRSPTSGRYRAAPQRPLDRPTPRRLDSAFREVAGETPSGKRTPMAKARAVLALPAQSAEEQARAAGRSADANEQRSGAAERKVIQLREEIRHWKQRAEDDSSRLDEALRRASSLAELTLAAEKRAAHAEGAAGALRKEADRAAAAEQRAAAADVRAAKAEGRVEVLCDLHGNLPRMIRAVASNLMDATGATGLDASLPVKAELPCPLPASFAGAARMALPIEDLSICEPKVIGSGGSVFQGASGSFADPIRVLEEMQGRRES